MSSTIKGKPEPSIPIHRFHDITSMLIFCEIFQMNLLTKSRSKSVFLMSSHLIEETSRDGSNPHDFPAEDRPRHC